MEIPTAVRDGLALIDAHTPDWHTKIERPLQMGSLSSCVLGQVFGDYGNGKSILDISNGAKYGFADYGDVWQYIINQRLNKTQESIMSDPRPGQREMRLDPSRSQIDQLIAKHAAAMRECYENRTAGDMTFTGLLAEFVWDLQATHYIEEFVQPSSSASSKSHPSMDTM